MDRYPQTTVLSRRTFLTPTSAALVGATLAFWGRFLIHDGTMC